MRQRLPAAATTVGVALIAVGAFAPRARATAVESYDAGGSAQGIVMTTAIKPSIFDPLAQAGTPYAEASLSSQGGGTAASFAAQIYPGKFGIGALGCSGAPGGPWHQAHYPTAGVCKESSQGALAPPFERFSAGPAPLNDAVNTVLDHTVVKTGFMRADAHFGESHALVRTQNVALSPRADGPPIVQAEQVLVTADGLRTDEAATQRTRSIAGNVSLLNGVIRIGSIEAVAETTSDGVTGTGAARLTIDDVEVRYEGRTLRATIDNRGVRINDPALSRSENLDTSEEFNDALLEAGISITVGEPVELVDGPSADASVGGLLLSMRGTVPSVRVPREVAPVIAQVVKQIPTNCLNDFNAPLPLCFGPGVLPSFGSQIVTSIEIASAVSHSVGLPSYVPPSVEPCVTGCALSPPGGPVSFGPGVVQGPAGAPGTPAIAPPAQGTIIDDRSRPVGLVARLPAVALLWGGVALLVLAVGTALAPSLRDAGAR